MITIDDGSPALGSTGACVESFRTGSGQAGSSQCHRSAATPRVKKP